MNNFQKKFPYLFLIKVINQKTKDISDYYLLRDGINTSLGMMLGQINCSKQSKSLINRKHLESKLKIAGSSVTHSLNRLEKNGCIIRTSNQRDNRNIDVTITEHGEKLLTNIDSALKKANDCLVLNMTENEKRMFFNLLERSLENLESFEKEQ